MNVFAISVRGNVLCKLYLQKDTFMKYRFTFKLSTAGTYVIFHKDVLKLVTAYLNQ